MMEADIGRRDGFEQRYQLLVRKKNSLNHIVNGLLSGKQDIYISPGG